MAATMILRSMLLAFTGRSFSMAENPCENEGVCSDEAVADEVPLLQITASPLVSTPASAAKKEVGYYQKVPAISRVYPAGDPSQTNAGFLNQVTGSLCFKKSKSPQSFTLIQYKICGLTPGKHGLHVHEEANFSDGCLSTLAHFNPRKNNHAAANSNFKHLGDLGNILVDGDGCAEGHNMQSNTPFWQLDKETILGRSIVVHETTDDLGRGGDDSSRAPAGGNAGGRVACGKIETVNVKDRYSVCPFDCYSVRCGNGTSVQSGAKNLVEGVCTYYCSQTIRGYRYCGLGEDYQGLGSIDCTACNLGC